MRTLTRPRITLPLGEPPPPSRRVLLCPERIAVEVELNLKSRARLETIVEQLSCEYDSVWYFAPERLRPRLIEFAQAAPYDNVTVHRYPPVVADWERRQTLPWA